MSGPVTFPRNLPTEYVPFFNNDYLSLDGFLDDAPTENFQVAIMPTTTWPPSSVTWVNNPGPKTPTTPGRYVVGMRVDSTNDPGVYVGFLIVS